AGAGAVAGAGAGAAAGTRRPGPAGADLARLWPDLLSRPHVRHLLGPGARPGAPHRTWPIPSRIGRSPLTGAGGRALFVGDAARAGDPMTGEGIAQALETGVLAALAILDAGALDPARAAASYRRSVATGLAVDDSLAASLSRVLGHPLGARGAVRITSATRPGAAAFARWLYEDYPRAIAVTPWRWRRRALSRPGAWT
ncbi:MAG: hypothetical protein ACRD0L_04565, partial [Acidimicrobiales bacterium]